MARVKHGTLTADTAATVALTVRGSVVEVANRSTTAEIFARTDGTAPVVDGDDSDVIPASSSARLRCNPFASAISVKLISTGTPKYTVTA